MSDDPERQELREILSAIREQRDGKEKTDKTRNFAAILMSVVGILIAVMVVSIQFVERDQQSRSAIEQSYMLQKEWLYRSEEITSGMQRKIDVLQQTIESMQKRLDLLEKRMPEKGTFLDLHNGIRRVQSASGGGQVEPIIPPEKKHDEAHAFVLKEYILPAIYLTLGILLLISALVSLASREQGRKETALEITKTLMSFFIGAATGQA